MKKNLLIIVATAMCFMVSCKDKNNNVIEENKNPEMQVLSPKEQKQKLINVADEMTSMINAKDQKKTLDLVEDCMDDLSNADWSEFENMVEENVETTKRLLLAASNPAYAMSQRPDMSFNYDDFAHIFEYDSRREKWFDKGESEDGSFLLIFDNGYANLEAKLSVSQQRVTYTLLVDGDLIEVVTPKTFTLTLKEGDYTHINITANIDIVFNDHVVFSVDAKVANITWNMATDVRYTKANASFSLAYSGTNMIKASFEVPSFKLEPYQGEEDVVEYAEYVEERYEKIIQTVGKAQGRVNIFGSVQVETIVSNFGELYEAYLDWLDRYDHNEGIYWCDNERYTKKANKALAGIFDEFCSANLYYSSDIIQAQLKLEPTELSERVYDYYIEGYKEITYYDIMPVIFFPQDESSYEFGDYFTERAFGDVIDMAEDIMDMYEKYFDFD